MHQAWSTHYNNAKQSSLNHCSTFFFFFGRPVTLKSFINSSHSLSMSSLRTRGLNDSGSGVSICPSCCRMLQSIWLPFLPSKHPCWIGEHGRHVWMFQAMLSNYFDPENAYLCKQMSMLWQRRNLSWNKSSSCPFLLQGYSFWIASEFWYSPWDWWTPGCSTRYADPRSINSLISYWE